MLNDSSDRDDDLMAEPSVAALEEGERWYVVHCLPSSEGRAEANLKHQAFRTFLPRRQKTIRHARRLMTVEAPFFPRYLFIVLDMGRHQWRCVNGTIGVSSLVMRGDEPHPVPGGIVEALLASADERGRLQLGHQFKIGETIRLMAGPFADQLATIERLDDAGRVRVLLDFLGRVVPTSTDIGNILPLLPN